jgi:hypothetical protein
MNGEVITLDWREFTREAPERLIEAALMMAMSGRNITVLAMRTRHQATLVQSLLALSKSMGIEFQHVYRDREFQIRGRGYIKFGVTTISGCCYEHTPVLMYYRYDDMERLNPQALQESLLIVAPDSDNHPPTIIKA